MNYNASAVKIYNAWRVFRIQIIFLLCKNTLAYYNAGVVANPTIMSNYARAVHMYKIYNAMISLHRAF
jgi:hypothetical protein